MIKAELLQEATDQMVLTLTVSDISDKWVFQEKHNGDRRLVEKNGDKIADFNRRGDRGKGLPPNIVSALLRHPLHSFIIDCEYVQATEQLFVFDMLHSGDEAIDTLPYSTRLGYLYSHFNYDDKDVQAVPSARTPEEKLALVEKIKGIRGEGFTMKELAAPYRPSEGNRRWNWKKKFWKDLDAVVIGDTTERDDKGQLKDAVRLGLYDEKGVLRDICGSTKKSAFTLRPGDVVKVKYLYGTGTLDVVQPTILEPRTDKLARECTLDQIVVNKNWKKWRKQ